MCRGAGVRACCRALRRSELGIEREFFIDNLLVRIHFIIVMIRWTGLASWAFEFPFPGSLTSTFLVGLCVVEPGFVLVVERFGGLNIRTTTSLKCAVVPRRARI